MSTAAVAIVGHRGRFDFSLSVDNFAYSPTASTHAALPTQSQLSPILERALARLDG